MIRTYAFFREIFDEIAAEYPDIEANHRYADAAGHDLVFCPEKFDVLVMENFLGDILSDVGAATIGGLGMCPSADIGQGSAYFELIHGSAPRLAGKNLANPTSQILSAAMLMHHVGEPEIGKRIATAVHRAFEKGLIRLGASGSPERGTTSVTKAVIESL